MTREEGSGQERSTSCLFERLYSSTELAEAANLDFLGTQQVQTYSPRGECVLAIALDVETLLTVPDSRPTPSLRRLKNSKNGHHSPQGYLQARPGSQAFRKMGHSGVSREICVASDEEG